MKGNYVDEPVLTAADTKLKIVINVSKLCTSKVHVIQFSTLP